MCWSNYLAIPIILKKPLKVYKVGTSTTFGSFTSLYQNFVYYKRGTMPTIEINPEFTRSFTIAGILFNTLGNDVFYIHEGYHSYLTKEMAECRKYDAEIGIFEIPVGAIVYVNYKYREVVSSDIRYLGLLDRELM